LTDTDPGLFFADDGAPRSARFSDIYYSLQDGLAESRAVFLGGCHLPEAWQGRTGYTVLELGFGTGLNIAALIQLWAESRPARSHLHIFSIEGFLMSAGAARQALAAWPELEPFAAALLDQWPAPRQGFHHMDFPQWGVSLTLALSDVGAALTAWRGEADAVFLDGFSPALNADMWSDEVLALVGRRCRPGARLATFTVAGTVRRGLQAAGFAVEKCPGFGRKRERLEAVFTANHAGSREAPVRRIAVVGAGIAGCALVYQATLLGVDADLFDAEGTGAGASGNPAALVTPRLDAGDNAISGLFADAYAYAGALYRRLCPQAIVGEGLSQMAAGPRDISRFTRIAQQAIFASGDLETFGLGGDPDAPDRVGIRINHALWVRPREVLDTLLGGRAAEIRRISAIPQGYDAVILACGDGVFDLFDLPARFDLRPVRGQVEFAADVDAPRRALSWGGYAVPLDGGLLFGATHERGDRGVDAREADRARNLESLAAIMPRRAAMIADGPLRSRASIRVMTRDYLPAIGTVAPGIHVLTGLGARGFCLAPLLARALLADLTGAPSPLAAVAANLLNVSRPTLTQTTDRTVSNR
jgi:tRNA 5-methylaminomethyl-2-thiouridine biosynthesis bifunctional protein